MPEWAAATIAGVVVATGGYIIRMLVRIAGTLGRIDANLTSQEGRLDRLERQQDNRYRGEHL